MSIKSGEKICEKQVSAVAEQTSEQMSKVRQITEAEALSGRSLFLGKELSSACGTQEILYFGVCEKGQVNDGLT